MTKAYKLAIAYFLIFTILLIMSSIALFGHKMGFTPESITLYYLGDIEQFIVAKNFSGLVKSFSPHLFAFALLAMVLLHFLIFTKQRSDKKTILLVYLTFTTLLLEIFSPLFIIYGIEFFSLIKLISFVVFEIALIYVVWLLFKSIFHS